MIDIQSAMQILLSEAGYKTWLSELNGAPLVQFEDNSLVGFFYEFEDPIELQKNWRACEMAILSKHASSFRSAGEKAWNVYCVFLCQKNADESQDRVIRWIDENLERTRKIAACGISTRQALSNAILPLLSLQYQPSLGDDDTTERLKRRVEGISPKVKDIFLDDSVSATEVARMLGENT